MSSISTPYLWTDFAIGCLNFTVTSFIIFTYFAWKAGRKTPGDIVLALAISSFILSIYWITFPIYYLSNAVPPIEDGVFCQSFGFISALGFSGQFVYNFAYCLTLRQAISNVIKVNTKFKLLTQGICFGLSLLYPVYIISVGQIGVDNFGLCACTLSKSEIFVEILLQFAYIISALYTIWYFYQNIPNDENLKKNKQKLLIRYVIYIISTVIMLLFMAISNIATELITESEVQNDSQAGQIYSLVSNIASSLGPCILCFIRFKNPQINYKLKRLIHSTFLQTNDKVEIEIPMRESDSSADPQFADLQRNIRIFQIKTILHGIIHYFTHIDDLDIVRNIELKNVPSSGNTINSSGLEEQLLYNKLDDDDRQIHETLKKYLLNNAALNKEFSFNISNKLGEELDDKAIKKNITLYPKMYALAPKFFHQLMYFEEIEIDAKDSFSPIKNEENIKNMVGPDGGKSGEFFFFTYDNKWILKTISDTDLQAFRMRFPEYIHHMNINRNSLITKIFAVFSIDMNQMQTQLSKDNSVYHMVLMKNLAQMPREYITRTFDLKGSEFAREVLKGKQSNSIDLSKITLKDKDFENTEFQIQLSQSQTEEIKNILTKDVKFFQKVELMDYSLLIMKVNWDGYLRDHQEISKEQLKKRFTQYQTLPVYGDAENQQYHFAIIDYFQEWNLKKQTEQKTKQIIAMNPNLDTSAQDPKKYAERFIINVVEKIFKYQDNRYEE